VLIDVNVLVAAHREDHPNHKVAEKWLSETVNGGDSSVSVVMSVGIVSSFVRLVTNSKLFPEPSSTAEAIDFIDWLLESKKAQFIQSTNEWESFRSIVLDGGLIVNSIPDAHLASLALSLSEPFVTFDKGFKLLLPRSLIVLLKSKN
jgi:uncharacterized protein